MMFYNGYWYDTEGYIYSLPKNLYFTFDAARRACYQAAKRYGVEFSRGIIG